MTIFDLLFLVVFLAALMALIAAAFFALRGQGSRAFRVLRSSGVALAIYLAIALTLNLLLPQRFLRPGEYLCSDDWCIAVTRAFATPPGGQYTVEFRVHSRALRRDQRENGVIVQLADDHDHRFDPLPDPSQVPFDTRLHPGETVAITRKFRVPNGAGRMAVLLSHDGPGWMIIGEGNFHPPAVWLDALIKPSRP